MLNMLSRDDSIDEEVYMRVYNDIDSLEQKVAEDVEIYGQLDIVQLVLQSFIGTLGSPQTLHLLSWNSVERTSTSMCQPTIKDTSQKYSRDREAVVRLEIINLLTKGSKEYSSS